MLIWKAYSRMIDALAFSPDGHTLAVGGYYLACRLIDPTTGARLWTADAQCAFGLSLAFTPEGDVLCKTGPLSTRAAANGAERRTCGTWCRAFAPAADGRTAFVADGGNQDILRQYDLATGDVLAQTAVETGAINRIAVSPNGELVALVGTKRLHLLTTDGLKPVAMAAHRALSTGAFALAFSPDGETLVYTAGRALFAFDITSLSEIARVNLDAKHFMDAAFTPDGRRLITVSKEGTARVWDTATWTCERAFAWDIGKLRAVAVAPDGTRAAAAGDTGRVVVWDLDA